MRTIVAALLSTLLTVGRAHAQFPPERATNLRILPKTLSMDSLMTVMGSFTRALGVRCSYCHLQRTDQTLEQVNFASDENPKKNTAREMLRMVAAINSTHLTNLTDRRQPAIEVTCITCHRGVAEPRPLQQVILTAYTAAGADSAATIYQNLRSRYFGSGSYDFGEVPLATFANTLRARGQVQDAIRFHALNAQMSPRSTFALRQLAESHLLAKDTAAAIAAYERALVISANDMQSRRAIDALRRRP